MIPKEIKIEVEKQIKEFHTQKEQARESLSSMLDSKTKTYFDVIDLRLMRIDESVQGKLVAGRVQEIIDNFKPDNVGVFTLSKRVDGLYYILDGQHRHKALSEIGVKDVVCHVYEGLDITQEAEHYLALNRDRKPPKAFDSFRVSLVKGEIESVEINEICEKNGIKLGYHVRGCSSFQNIYRKYGKQMLDITLNIYISSLGIDRFNQNVLMELAHMVANNKNINLKTLSNRLSKQGVKKIVDGGRTMVATGSAKSSMSGLSQYLYSTYNYGLREENTLIWAQKKRS